MGPKIILTKEEELKLVEYIHFMVEWDHPMTPTQVKAKVTEITQERPTPFINGIPGKSWLKWFKVRHPSLVLRVPQGLDYKKAGTINPTTCVEFYNNLASLYDEHFYPLHCI